MHDSPSISHILLQPMHEHSTDMSCMPLKGECVSTGTVSSLKM